MPEAKWTMRLSRFAIWLAVAAIVVAAVGVTLARYDLIPKLVGFSGLALGGLASIVAVIVSVLALILNLRFPTSKRNAAIAALILSLPFAGFIISRPMAAGGAPSIHDITTDLANPPTFKRLKMRPDNLTGVGSVENWRAIHARAYPDLKPLKIAKPAPTVLADAARIARKLGWKVALDDPAAGQLEATDSVSFIRFQDDVIVRVVPSDGGKASIVDMRSISRIGGGDLGVNARRVRGFLKSLASGG